MSHPIPTLHHERLDAYRAAIELLTHATTIRFPSGHAPLRDQLRRASTSIALNIAEGYGKRSRSDRARFYDIARGSAHECAAIMDVAFAIGAIDGPRLGTVKHLLGRIVSMLVKMA